ncbi:MULTISPECIES: efflux RND transporter periplasmic adaptor subunit [Dysgonomonas]|uniref:efflux RND transporter periplasmic adaptor subunit n=1 Tax=Dysgonomonas TaxID=156973 RepID=UPI0018842EFC|nr:efflux RND transporter periplasmic adaptor subunit [Dysgonomonas sp. GY75]MBF0649574.1 efflux RND transporter periplasmic adaptor subunit [Dysgonomonas sp. GY75]
MNKKLKKYLITAAIIAIVAAGIFLLLPSAKGSAIILDTAKAEKGNISIAVTATGTIEPITLVEVGTQVSGVISKIYVDFNSEVKAGQVLAELDKRLLVSELENANANLQTRQVELILQKQNYDRQKGLWEKQAISKVDWENAESTYQTAQLAVTSSKAAVLKAQTNLGYATITSTIDGVVISRAVEEGQTVAASFSTPTLFTIANDLTKMRVIANVDEADIGGVKEGQRVTFTVDAFPDDEFEGKVVQVRLEATTTSNVVTYEVVIDAPNPELKLKPGLTASVNIYTQEEQDVLVVPSKALRFNPDPDIMKNFKDLTLGQPLQFDPKDKTKKVVWVKSGNTLSPKQVTVGTTDGVHVSVKEGLNQGEVVVTGISQETNSSMSEPEKANGESSPFMPQRPGGNRRR